MKTRREKEVGLLKKRFDENWKRQKGAERFGEHGTQKQRAKGMELWCENDQLYSPLGEAGWETGWGR